MLPARFKVRNYCSIAWNEPLPGGKIASGASVVRVRSSQIVEKATFSFTKNVEDELMKLRKFLDVDIFAQANAFNYWLNDQSPELKGEKIVVVNISESEMYSLVMQDGQILYKQESPLGGEQLNQLIQRTYQVSEEQAQVMQRGGDRPADYQIQISDRFNVQVAQEVQRVLQFYYTTQSGEQFSNVKHIFLTGSVSAQIGLTEVIFSQTNTAAECINPINCLQYGKQVDVSELHQDESGLTVAFGLALRGL